MATITETQTVEAEYRMDKSVLDLIALRKSFMHPITKYLKPKPAEKPVEQNVCNIPNCSCKTICPPDCPCRQEKVSRPAGLFLNALGILLAILAAYMIISTDSKLYLVFWIGYSVLRRMITKTRKHLKAD